MENENETVENLFENDVQNDNEVSNAFVDLPPVAPEFDSFNFFSSINPYKS